MSTPKYRVGQKVRVQGEGKVVYTITAIRELDEDISPEYPKGTHYYRLESTIGLMCARFEDKVIPLQVDTAPARGKVTTSVAQMLDGIDLRSVADVVKAGRHA